MVFLFLLAVSLAAIGYLIFVKGRANEHYFKDSGLKYVKPTFICGNMAPLVLARLNIFDFVKKLYNDFPEEKANGIFDMRSPGLFIRDPNLLKILAIKEFDNFTDHKAIIDESIDSFFGNTLVSLSGQKWKDMRATLSPAFTGSKMRLMFQLIVDVAVDMMKHVSSESTAKGGSVEYEMKDFCSKYTNDVIALCAFGIKVNTLENPENEFFRTGKEIMNFSKLSRVIKFLGYRFFPTIMKFLRVQLIEPQTKSFFTSMVLESMAYREEKKIYRPDMINLLMDARKGKLTHSDSEEKHESAGFATVTESDIGKNMTKREWNDDEIIAQCFIFFLAGFDTSSTLLSFATYEMMLHPEIQDKLYEEIKEVNEVLNGAPLTYELMQKMKYLDMVVTETLRKWPPAAATDRICMKDLSFDDGNGFKYDFKKGMSIFLPIYGLHHDPKYYPEPDRFDPERFSDENRDKINPDTYLPFGIGPRNCIGSRFALMSIKTLLYYMLLNFSLVVVEKTQIPLKIKTNFGIVPEKGIWVGLEPRNKSNE